MSERVERSGWRDQAYSDWHRQLQFRPEYRAIAGGYYMLDLDAVEYRHGKETVALMELKRGGSRPLLVLNSKCWSTWRNGRKFRCSKLITALPPGRRRRRPGMRATVSK